MLIILMINIVHFILIVLNMIYIFIFVNKTYIDIFFILYFLLLNIHWILLKGECILAYLYKKYKNNDYILGDDIQKTEISDMTEIINKYIPWFNNNISTIIIFGLYILNIFVVLKRNNINLIFNIILLTSLIVYLVLLRSPYKQIIKTYSYIHLYIFVTALIMYIYKLTLELTK